MSAPAILDHVRAPTDLSILTLSAPILSTVTNADLNTQYRASNVSSTDDQVALLNPSALQTDLQHYQELFSKLRFSHVEQGTKERFLRALTALNPEFVSKEDNDALEEVLREEKRGLKERKEEARGLIVGVGEQGRELVRRYELVQLQQARLEALPTEIENLRTRIASLESAQAPQSANPSLNLPLQPTLSLLAEREAQLADTEARIAALQTLLPAKRREVENLEAEIVPLEARKKMAVGEAQEARRRRGAGGLGKDGEAWGRWLRGVEGALREMVEV